MPDTPHLIERAAFHLVRGSPLEQIAASAPPEPRQGEIPSFGHAGASGATVKLAEIQKAGLVSDNAEPAYAKEELWHIQRQLLRTAFTAAPADLSAPPNLVLVTSARPREGKSFAALNLAASIVRQGDHPVLLMDVDFKPGALTDLLEVAGEPGLLDCVDGDSADLARAICPTEIPGLSFLPHGSEPRDAPDPLSRKKVGQLLQRMALDAPERLIIVDAAPCLVRGDAAALAPVVGGIVLVVEAERTPRKDVEYALDQLDACATISLLLNKSHRPARNAQNSTMAPYYYYYRR